MNSPDYSISTPENVDLHLELAGMGNRVLACFIDTLITYAICLGFWVLVWLGVSLVQMAGLPMQANAIACGIILLLGILSTFIVMFGYFIFFEGIWHGQTPGKKVAHTRVIDQSGQPVSTSSTWIRNLLRIVDMGFMLVGLIVMIFDKNERRLGDLMAGTLVIRERLPALSTTDIAVLPEAKENTSLIDVGRISPEEYQLLIGFLKRRVKMAKSQRPLVARELAEHFRDKLSAQDIYGSNPELFLERVYTAYQSRAES